MLGDNGGLHSQGNYDLLPNGQVKEQLNDGADSSGLKVLKRK